MTLTFKMLPVSAVALMLSVAPLSFAFAQDSDAEMAMAQAAELRVAFEGNNVEVTESETEVRVLLPGGMDFLLADQLEGFSPQTASVVLADSFREYPDSDIRIGAYSAADGALVFNDTAGIAHAQALAAMLIANGVEANRIMIDGADNADVNISTTTDMDPTRQMAIIISLAEDE